MHSSGCVDRLFFSDRRASTVGMPRKSQFSFLLLSSSLYPFSSPMSDFSSPFLFWLSSFFLFLIFLLALIKSEGNFPPLSSLLSPPHICLIFSLFLFSLFSLLVLSYPTELSLLFAPILNFFFLILFSFPIISSTYTWLNVSHSYKCTTWLMPCVTLLGCHVTST